MKSLSLTQPHAIVMVGVPGSGKSFFAKKFSDTFNAPLISSDTIAPHVSSKNAINAIVEDQLSELLKTKQSIILEIDSSTRQSRTKLAKTLKEAGYVPLTVWVQTDQETALQRAMKSRGADKDTLMQEIDRFTPPHESEKPLVISGKHTYATQAKIVLKRLSAPRAEITSHKQPLARTSGNSIIIR